MRKEKELRMQGNIIDKENLLEEKQETMPRGRPLVQLYTIEAHPTVTITKHPCTFWTPHRVDRVQTPDGPR